MATIKAEDKCDNSELKKDMLYILVVDTALDSSHLSRLLSRKGLDCGGLFVSR